MAKLVHGEALPARREDWRGAVAYLNRANLPDGSAVPLASGLIEADALRTSDDAALCAFCSYPLRSAYPLDVALEIVPLPFSHPGRVEGEVASLLRGRENTYVIFRGGGPGLETFQRELRGSVRPARVRRVRSFGNVHLLVVEPLAARQAGYPPDVSKC